MPLFTVIAAPYTRGMTSKTPLQLVWFKRDLRVEDHRALVRAALAGPVLPLYVVEPELWQQPDMSRRQWAFIAESLAGLREDLAALGQPLIIRTGQVTDILDQIVDTHGIAQMWSHEETGNGWTFARDKAVARWCKARSVPWVEVQMHGVVRRIDTRNGWAKRWDTLMGEPTCDAPRGLPPIAGIDPGPIPTAKAIGLEPDPCPGRQTGGRQHGEACLQSFLYQRGEHYRKDMSSPVTGFEGCSRLSPHLAWGTLSMREITQATWDRQRELKNAPSGTTGGWRPSMRSFSGRLHWHCHFMQKLEDQPNMEFEELHPAYKGMRPTEPDPVRLEAWCKGETGLPFVDACMRALNETGWLNFRMRAMLMAVASYHLWLPWRASGMHLARQFTDYEPGIHWPQTQMQSGTTGINTVRIYNPVKQGHDQDPTGGFVRRWLPELGAVPDAFIQSPWEWPECNSVLDKAYPFPIIDHKEAAKEARQKIYGVRKGSQYRNKADAIQTKHGSRKSGIPNRGEKPKPARTRARKTKAESPAPDNQMSLGLD
ncbi:MAG: deoxyribodipyrimidine photo-lyase [Pseudomonadota bacterium]